MSITQQYYNYSQLSLTAYAEALNIGALTNTSESILNNAGLANAQIDALVADGWEIISQSSDALYGSSGFSATLFHNIQTNEYVFANRGTAGAQDLFIADAWGIAALGIAGSQVIDMYRYYKQLITPNGQSVSYSLEELNTLYEIGRFYAPLSYGSISQIVNLTSNDTGLGKISATQTFAATGHSLGGHLAMWLNALAPASVDHVYTYNGAGQGNLLRSAITLITGIVTGTPITTTTDSDVTNLYASGGATIIAGVGGAVGSNIPVDIEYKSVIDSVLNLELYNHSIVRLTDAIAVANLFNKLDTNVTTQKFNDLFLKSSNVIGTSLEGLLDGLRKYIGKTDSTPNDDRTMFYDNLYELQNSTSYQSLIGKVTLAAPPNGASEARSDLGLFLSLYYLTPFALKTDGSIAADAQLTIANPDIATQFKDDKLLTPEQIANGEANFSDMWLNDRAAMLSWELKVNAADKEATEANPYVGLSSLLMIDTSIPSQYFEDKTTNQKIVTGAFNPSIERRRFIFGTDTGSTPDDTLTGGDNSDHLYGMGGDDTLNGGKGNDWLEGGEGIDTLKGGEGADILYGGAEADTLNGDEGRDRIYGGNGDDILQGGQDNDTLYGGADNDTYKFSSGDGWDWITDSDGLGKITYNGKEIRGGKQLGSGANITAEVINLFTGVNVPTTYDAARAYFVSNDYVVESGNESLLLKTANDTFWQRSA